MNELIKFFIDNQNEAIALSATASAFIAIFAFFVSMFSLFISYRVLKTQQQHNKLSVTPIADATVADYEDCLCVKIRNNGSGPLIVIDLHVGDGARTTKRVLDWMPDLPANYHWSTFAGNIKSRSILPGHEIILIQLNGDCENKVFRKIRDECRYNLSKLTLNLEYEDIYKTKMKPYRKKLDWFSRNILK